MGLRQAVNYKTDLWRICSGAACCVTSVIKQNSRPFRGESRVYHAVPPGFDAHHTAAAGFISLGPITGPADHLTQFAVEICGFFRVSLAGGFRRVAPGGDFQPVISVFWQGRAGYSSRSSRLRYAIGSAIISRFDGVSSQNQALTPEIRCRRACAPQTRAKMAVQVSTIAAPDAMLR